jgi:hypothetical protein
MTTFTKTELIMISLVMNQNADEYGEPTDDAYRDCKRIAQKAREMADAQES